jgi:hypothetical protein
MFFFKKKIPSSYIFKVKPSFYYSFILHLDPPSQLGQVESILKYVKFKLMLGKERVIRFQD